MHHKANNLGNLVSLETLNDIAKVWLTVMLFMSPYQAEIMRHIGSWNANLSRIVQLLDEVTIIVFFPLAMILIYKERIRYRLFLLILLPLCLFGLAGLFSGIINSNSLLTTTYGSFYYIKYFFLIIIYAAFFRELNHIKKIFRYLLILAVIGGFVAFVQELWSVVYYFSVKHNFPYKAITVINSVVSGITQDNLQNNLKFRFGFLRTSSLMSHYNLLGFYSLMMLTIYTYSEKKLNPMYAFFLLAGIYCSMSRVAFAGLVILGVIQIFKGRKWLILCLIIPIIILSYSFSSLSTMNLLNKNDQKSVTYRQYAREKALLVWKDHPYFGVGPGMFGGAIARRVHSQFYEEYNFSNRLLNEYSDLDQFWPQVFAETGITGTILFAGLYLSLFVVIIKARRDTIFNDSKYYLAGLTILTGFIIMNTLASSLNIVSILKASNYGTMRS